MPVPKIKFQEMTLEENIDIIKWAYFEGNDVLEVHNYTIQYFPQLANLDAKLSREKICKIIEEVVTNEYGKFIEKIKQEVERYSILWSHYNDEYFEKLSLYLDVTWPNSLKEINCSIGLIPVFPRNLDDYSFSIGININDLQLLEICAHETLHFLWFEKWMQIYSETSRAEFDSPYLVWQYSEMVTDPILNSEPFLNMFDFVERSYDSFYEITDGDTNIIDNLRNIYASNKSINEKIKTGFGYIKKVFDDTIPEKITRK